MVFSTAVPRPWPTVVADLGLRDADQPGQRRGDPRVRQVDLGRALSTPSRPAPPLARTPPSPPAASRSRLLTALISASAGSARRPRPRRPGSSQPGHLGLGLGQRLLQLARIESSKALPLLDRPPSVKVHRLEEARDRARISTSGVSERLATHSRTTGTSRWTDLGDHDVRRRRRRGLGFLRASGEAGQEGRQAHGSKEDLERPLRWGVLVTVPPARPTGARGILASASIPA